MKLKLPSPSMIVALIALVMALSGTAVAAVSFATNAGAVDGKSAVADGALLAQSAGRLVATQRSGEARGRIRAKYLDLSSTMRGQTATFGRAFDVADNQTLAPLTIGSVPGLGSVTATCNDQNPTVGVEDPSTTIAFANASGDAVNISKRVGNGAGSVAPLANGVQSSLTINGSNTFEMHLERKGFNYALQGVVRQDGTGSAGAQCLVYGFALIVPPSR
jgi:hypothetical protein